MKHITLTPVESSQLHSIGHDRDSNTLAIRFRGKQGQPGALYHYGNFTAEDFDALVAAPSLGSHFIRNIKPKTEQFPCERIDERHPDDQAVDAFASAMKTKLAEARERGRGGWDDPERCDVDYLAKLLLEQLRKPDVDLVDLGNFAMFLHHRAGGADAVRANIAQAQGVHPDA